MSAAEADIVFSLSDEHVSAAMENFLREYPEPPDDGDALYSLPHYGAVDQAIFGAPFCVQDANAGFPDTGDPLCSEAGEFYPSTCSEVTAPASCESQPAFFGFIKILQTKQTVDHFWASVEDEATVVLPCWPPEVPVDGFFYGNIDLGAVDFGGIKSGTAYEADDTFGILVNYCGDSSGKLSSMYPNERSLKLWKIRLYSIAIPEDCASDDWSLHSIRASGSLPSSVYLYNKMALYVFGGDIYFQNHYGSLQLGTPPDVVSSKSFVPLGPSARSSCKTAKKRRANDSPKMKKSFRRRANDIFDP